MVRRKGFEGSNRVLRSLRSGAINNFNSFVEQKKTDVNNLISGIMQPFKNKDVFKVDTANKALTQLYRK